MIDNYLPRIHVHFAALVIIVGGVSLPPDVVAAYVIFTNEAEFRLASGPVGLETFNSQINDTPFHTTPLDVGDFVVSMTGFPETNNNRNLVDAPPLYLSDFDIDGSTLLNVLTFSTDSLFLTFKTPITSFGVYLGNFNDSRIRTSIVVAGSTTEPAPGGDAVDVRFFGIVSNNLFDTVEFRGIDNDGYGLDNVLYGSDATFVPLPPSSLFMISALAGMFRRQLSGLHDDITNRLTAPKRLRASVTHRI